MTYCSIPYVCMVAAAMARTFVLWCIVNLTDLVSLAHCKKEDTNSVSCKLDVLRHLICDPLGSLPMYLSARTTLNNVRIRWDVRRCAWLALPYGL